MCISTTTSGHISPNLILVECLRTGCSAPERWPAAMRASAMEQKNKLQVEIVKQYPGQLQVTRRVKVLVSFVYVTPKEKK